MKAAVHDGYGAPELLTIEDVQKPEAGEDSVLVRVRAASLNRLDWYGLKGPLMVRVAGGGLRKPKDGGIGVDFAGTVEAVGAGVTHLKPGDEVFGQRAGSCAEYVSVKNVVALKPANMSFEEAAALPAAALTALQGIRDKGEIQPGQRVLVHGASGGVGTFAVQIAKALGAGSVTAVCGPRGVEVARSIGADRVVDYTLHDFTRDDERYDLFVDVAGTRPWRACRRVLAPDATVVLVGGPYQPLVGPLGHTAAMSLGAKLARHRAVFFIAKPNAPDLDVLRELVESGKLRSVIDRRYDLNEIADAIRYLGQGHPQGKVVITI